MPREPATSQPGPSDEGQQREPPPPALGPVPPASAPSLTSLSPGSRGPSPPSGVGSVHPRSVQRGLHTSGGRSGLRAGFPGASGERGAWARTCLAEAGGARAGLVPFVRRATNSTGVRDTAGQGAGEQGQHASPPPRGPAADTAAVTRAPRKSLSLLPPSCGPQACRPCTHTGRHRDGDGVEAEGARNHQPGPRAPLLSSTVRPCLAGQPRCTRAS